LSFCFVESALKNFPGTEADVTKALSSLLKYAPDRRGGGGRHAQPWNEYPSHYCADC